MHAGTQEYDSFGEGGKEHLKAKKVKAQIDKAQGKSREIGLRNCAKS